MTTFKRITHPIWIIVLVLAFVSVGCNKNDDDDENGGGVWPSTQVDGSLPGLFSISGSQQVYFSKGNLQYQASTNTWQFAENQWDYIGANNSQISSTYNGWIDLFGWGTSGYNHGAVCYQPWSTSVYNRDYYAYGQYNYGLSDQSGKADWGYNAINNGGNRQNYWRTLTIDEWEYLLETRTTTSGIRFAKAQVNEVGGLILLPDDWDANTYSLSNANSDAVSAYFSDNTIAASQWTILEDAGAVFLPAAGSRTGTIILPCVPLKDLINTPCSGYYWSASQKHSRDSCGIFFLEGGLHKHNSRRLISSGDRYVGLSVRLVRNAE